MTGNSSECGAVGVDFGDGGTVFVPDEGRAYFEKLEGRWKREQAGKKRK